MCEYIRKQSLLEYLDICEADSLTSASDYDMGIARACRMIREQIQSGVFDAPDGELQRLRAALERIKEHEMHHYKYKTDVWYMAEDALSTTTETTKANEPKYGSKEYPYVYYEDHIDGREIVPEYVVRSGRRRRK